MEEQQEAHIGYSSRAVELSESALSFLRMNSVALARLMIDRNTKVSVKPTT
jgi:hypothetical protein